ncbi:MAG: hypothetical protein ACI9EW_003037 [Cellvibrionaceae bacterium]|jgi:hypothetical protein
MHSQEIPIANLKTELHENMQQYSESILENEIKGIHVEHVAITSEDVITDYSREGYKIIYLFVKGTGNVIAANTSYEIVPETILLPNIVKKIVIKATKNDTLHYLKISTALTAQDHIDLKEFPVNHTQNLYYAKFIDCQSYTEQIKSRNTISRTILPNKYIPRIAMGTVQTKGPDKVGAHEHAMLEQLFLGLTKNNCTVYADDTKVDFLQYSVLHIPLGSRHSVSVEKDEIMYYVWMDFFLDKKGEEWLKNHKVNDDNE